MTRYPMSAMLNPSCAARRQRFPHVAMVFCTFTGYEELKQSDPVAAEMAVSQIMAILRASACFLPGAYASGMHQDRTMVVFSTASAAVQFSMLVGPPQHACTPLCPSVLCCGGGENRSLQHLCLCLPSLKRQIVCREPSSVAGKVDGCLKCPEQCFPCSAMLLLNAAAYRRLVCQALGQKWGPTPATCWLLLEVSAVTHNAHRFVCCLQT